jgi:hypothetical protein
MGSNLTRYAYWHLRDFIRERGLALLITSTLLGFTFVAPMRAMMGSNIDEANAKRILVMALPQIVYIAAFIGLNGIISTDRKFGYYRFLFSKPVSIPAYYAQYFVISLVGFVAAFALLFGVFAIVVRPLNFVPELTFCALVYLSLGGIAFLISSLFRFDWPILAGVYLGALIANGMWAQDTGWRMVIRDALPPLQKLSAALTDLMNFGTLDTKAVAWLLGYSALCFAAGLIVLWRRPIG